MSFLDKIKEKVSDNEDEIEDFYGDTNEDTNLGIDPPKERSSRRERDRERERDKASKEEHYSERPRMRRHESEKVVNIHTTTQLQVVLAKPRKYEEAAAIADNLAENRAVVINLESTDHDTARRLLDFLSGAAYASNGQIKRVSNGTYMITPYNVDVMGDLLDELENNGMFM